MINIALQSRTNGGHDFPLAAAEGLPVSETAPQLPRVYLQRLPPSNVLDGIAKLLSAARKDHNHRASGTYHHLRGAGGHCRRLNNYVAAHAMQPFRPSRERRLVTIANSRLLAELREGARQRIDGPTRAKAMEKRNMTTLNSQKYWCAKSKCQFRLLRHRDPTPIQITGMRALLSIEGAALQEDAATLGSFIGASGTSTAFGAASHPQAAVM